MKKRAKNRVFKASRDPAALPELLRNTEHLLTKHSDGSIYCQTHRCPADECARRLTSDLIWSNSLDRGTYTATVTRIAPYRGLLTLTRLETNVLQREVTISYDAPYGPDAEDIVEWRDICGRAADADYARRGESVPSPKPPSQNV